MKRLDRIDETYGRWTVLAGPPMKVNGHRYWSCMCACGSTKMVSQANLRSGVSTGCGCDRVDRVNKLNARKIRNASRCSFCHLWSTEDAPVSNYMHLECRRKYYKDKRDRPGEKDKYRRMAILQRRKLKFEVLAAYGGRCVCCGESHSNFLCIDHLYGDGSKQRKELGHKGVGNAFLRWLKHQGYPKDRYRILCFNCNMSLGLYGECPHGLVSERNGLVLTEREYIASDLAEAFTNVIARSRCA